MKINTRKFGDIDIDETKILTMPEGLPGFLEFKRFILLENPDTKPFCWFQSVENPNLALVVINPFLFKPDYNLDLKGVIRIRKWSAVRPEDLLIYVVVNISETNLHQKKITANLIGPLIINPFKNEVVQLVLSDGVYSHKYNILEPGEN